MKKLYFFFIVWGLMISLFSACSDDKEQEPPHIPTLPEVSIINVSGITTCLPKETVELKARLLDPTDVALLWTLEGEQVSTDTVYKFTPEDFGEYRIILTATNSVGSDADTLTINVSDGQFRFANIKNWTGEGENRSALAIQWITGTNMLEPTDDEVFFLAWGYRWEKGTEPLGIDMLRAIAKEDPRLYVAQSGSYIIGFGYDGNNDGKIEVSNGNLTISQDNFVDGFYELSSQDFDNLKPVDPEDYWLGGLYKAYPTYWLGQGNVVPESEEFDYSNFFVIYRSLEDLSWDAWTLSPIDYEEMRNTLPIPRLLQAAEPNKK